MANAGKKVDLVLLDSSVDSAQKGKGFAPVAVKAMLPSLVAFHLNGKVIVFTAAEILPRIMPLVREVILKDPAAYGVTIDANATGKGGTKAAAVALPADLQELFK